MRSRFILMPARSSAALFYLFLLCLLAAFARTAMANPVGIQDASFDNRSLASGAYNATLTPWQETGGTGNSAGFIERISGFAADGANHLGMALNHNVWQDLAVTYQPNTRYTLTVAVGNRGTTHTLSSNQSRYILASSDGTVHATGTFNASTIPAGTFADAPALVFETGSVSAAIGKTVRIRLEARGSGRSHFDRVRLTAVPKQEQTITFAELEPVAVGYSPVTLTASASSGLAVTFSSSNPSIASVSGGTLTIHAAGNLTITASQAGNGVYIPAVSVQRQLIVYSSEKSAQTISFPRPVDPVHGALPLPLSATTSSGLPVAFSSSDSAVATIEGGILQARQAGTVVITARQPGNAGFLAAEPVSHQIEVQPGVLIAPGVLRFEVARDAADFTVDVPITSRSGDPLAWTAALDEPPAWLDLLDPAGVTPANLRLMVSPGAARPGTQSVELRIATGNWVFPVNVILTVANGSPFEVYEFPGGGHVPVTTNAFSPAGREAYFELRHIPATGTDLTVVKVTGMGFIEGTFDNLPQGARVELPFDGRVYPFVVNYFGGDGNDLVLQWANVRLVAWGYNSYGQLGDGSAIDRLAPVAVVSDRLAGRTPLVAAAGNGLFSMVLAADGTAFSWGENSYGQLGNGSSALPIPHPIKQDGELFGKTVISLAAGNRQGLALCSDGSTATWGESNFGVGLPVLVDRTGVLAGRTVVAVAAGSGFRLALCSDGKLVSWGENSYGKLGTGNSEESEVPVAVIQSGVLAGKTVRAIAAGSSHCLVLCEDGTLASWGYNGEGQLGNGTTVHSNVPVLVNRSGILTGKSVVSIAAGTHHSMVLCSDGTIAAWGSNDSGRLGTLEQNNRPLPTEVVRSGALSGKTAVEIRGGIYHSLALCSDGTIAAWGGNPNGQLGNGTTTSSSVPVAVSNASLLPGERFICGLSAADHNLARVAVPLAPHAVTLAAANIRDGGAILRGRVIAHDRTTSVAFEYGTTTALGSRLAASPAALAGSTFSEVSLPLEDLIPGTTYHYRVVATSATGTSAGEIRSFTTGSEAMLAGLVPDAGTLAPLFQGNVTRYNLTVSPQTSAISLTATAINPAAAISVNGQAAEVGKTTATVPLAVGVNPVTITVTAPGGLNSLTYRLNAIRLPGSFTFTSSNSGAVQAEGFDLQGLSASFALGFPPAPGTGLVVLKNDGQEPIAGTFENLPQGAPVVLTHEGIAYRFTADYFGGDGNDLVLRWASQRILAWGTNTTGQLGDGSEAARAIPSPADPQALLAGAAIRSVSAGTGFSIALLVDGRLAAWGINDVGQLGNGSKINNNRPVWVDTEGVLAGKTVVRVACGTKHTLALCADGSLVAWGDGSSGQLGYGGSNSSAVPVRVDQRGVLAGKRIIGLAAGANQSLVLCDDGTLATWGSNFDYTGGSSATISRKPRLQDSGTYLAGKRLVGISAGNNFNTAFASDGSLYSWGRENSGSLGHFVQSYYPPNVPFPVNSTDALFGRPAMALSTKNNSSLVLCEDGRLVHWGGSSGYSGYVSLVDASGVLAARTVAEIACAPLSRLVRCSDNTLIHWNYESFSFGPPALVDLATLKPSERLGPIAAGENHFLVLVDSPPAPQAVTLAATDITDTSAVLPAAVRPNGGQSAVLIEFGPTPAFGQSLAVTPALASGTGETEVSAAITGLIAGTTYHFRVIATSNGGTARGERATFKTTDFASLAGLSLSHGTITPTFDSRVTGYHAVVASGIESITLTPQANEAASTVGVAGIPVASGSESAPQPLAVGNQTIEIEVIAPGGANTTTYHLTVTRLPGLLVLDGSGQPSLVVESLAPAGNPLPVALGFKPPVGTNFTLAEVTGPAVIAGNFSGLEHGQTFTLEHDGVAYDFIVNYHGGDGNDLVLQWTHTRPIAWGFNFYGQLGAGGKTISAAAVPVTRSGVLAGKTVIAITGGDDHSLALCADGTLASWGNGSSGGLGLGPDVWSSTSSSVPMAVYQNGLLAGKSAVAIAAGTAHSLVLCSDGTLAAWGGGGSGQLGDGTTTSTNASPVAVNRTGVLAGRRVVRISARANWSLAVCDDGRVAAWGANSQWQLGNGNTTSSKVPVLVDHSGVLAGKRVVSAAAGSAFALALCSDGSLVTWGYNSEGQLGNGLVSETGSMPVLVDQSGVLAGKTVVGIAAGASHCLVWCSDGTLAAWGANSGRLGDGTTTRSSTPVRVDRSGVLAGKQVVMMLAGMQDSVALCDDGTVAHSGLGFSIGMSSTVPKALDLAILAPGERVVRIGIGAVHGLGVVAMPPPPRQVETLAANAITDTTVTLRGRASGNGSTAAVRFEYGTTPALGNALIAEAGEITGTSLAEIPLAVAGLQPGSTYYYRLLAQNAYGSVAGEILNFTTTRLADLAGLVLDRGSLSPTFSPARLHYDVTLPADAGEIRITPVLLDPAASVTVAGAPAASGVVVPLATDATAIPVVVTSADSINSRVYQITVTRLPLTLDLTADPQPVVRAAGFSIDGAPPGFSLGKVPVSGDPLRVLETTGIGMISGRFNNLAQGQTVYLSHGGIDYPYVVNYFGGSGNDLVFEWANTRLFSWGSNSNGQLGDGTSSNRLLPTPVDANGTLAGRTVIGGGCGEEHSAVLCADGSLFAWGRNLSGQLGTGAGNTSQLRPVAVVQTGALADKRVVALSVGRYYTLARCDDGTVFGWGANSNGQLGDGSATDRNLPVATSMTGALAGKRVVALSAGSYHNLALCDDGTLAAWGYNDSGQLGNGITVNSPLPVAVDQTGVLSGKQVVAIVAGNSSSYALCSDGTVAAWGGNGGGQLGDGTKVTRLTPVRVRNDGVLADKSVVAIAAGIEHTLGLCSDGTLAAWGNNSSGSLGTGNTTNSDFPVLVSRAGLLAGKVVRSIHAASYRSFAMCDDGTLAAWGNNGSGALGNNTSTQSTTPIAASMVNLLAGEKMTRPLTGSYTQSNLAIIASPVTPAATTLAASGIGDNRAVLHGSVNANGQSATLSFEYGPTTAYGLTVAASPATVDGTGTTPVSAELTDLLPGTTYHFRVVAAGSFGVVRGENQTFTTSALATLADLSLEGAAIEPAFQPLIAHYRAVVSNATSSIRVTPVAAHADAVVEVNDSPVASGSASAPIDLVPGENEIRIAVTAAGGASRMDYRVTVTRVRDSFVFRNTGDPGMRVPFFSGAGMNASFALEYAPAPGTNLRVIEQSGIRPIQGAFDNLVHGQEIMLSYDDMVYRFVANYFGGDGNDLVLHWADTVLNAWGRNQESQIGNASTTNALLPVPVDLSAALAGKTITAVASGYRHSLALCSDGTLAAWGRNNEGQLGDGTTTSRSTPVLVNQSGALAGRTVVAIAAADFHSLVLCSDGSLYSWGSNEYGKLGNGSTVSSPVPVAVVTTGALAGKRPVAISCAGSSNLVLCDDGALVSWGANFSGQLGLADFTGSWSDVPRLLDASGALAGRQVVRISAGANHTVALCADGSLVAWGDQQSDVWGNGNSSRSMPVLVSATGLFSGRKIIDISLGANHALALCEDQTIIAWGNNSNGRLGNNSATSPGIPVLVDRSGILAGSQVVSVIARDGYSLAVCADGRVAAWGANSTGQLGIGTTTQSLVPAWVTLGAESPAAATVVLSTGVGSHSLRIAGAPPAPLLATLAAADITDDSARLSAGVTPNGGVATVFFEYGTSTDYGQTLSLTPSEVSGDTAVEVSATLGGLLPDTTYHYRAVATKGGLTRFGENRSFTTTSESTLATLLVENAVLSPEFSKQRFQYHATVPFATAALRVTPVTTHPEAVVRINGSLVPSGDASPPLPLAVGANAISVAVVAGDGTSSLIYQIAVIRLPEAIVIDSPEHTPFTAETLVASGLSIPIQLNHAPPIGTEFTLVEMTGNEPISGYFENLAQGQTIWLRHGEISYPFIVDYRGGRGTDLVLRWGNHRAMAWGGNSSGQLGDMSTIRRTSPVNVMIPQGALRQLAAGDTHSLALYADGTMLSWGESFNGRLGRDSNVGGNPPGQVDAAGVLGGKHITSIAVGYSFNLALADDGTLYSWGTNQVGQLGDGSFTERTLPVGVLTTGVLANRRVQAIAVGSAHSLVLCSDGTLAAWGQNSSSQLGNGTTSHSPVPVSVDSSGALAGKRVVAIAAGESHNLALCSDGTLVAWGQNSSGQFGNGTTTSSSVPVTVAATGVLAGKTITAISAGSNHSLALASDGTLAAWGQGDYGRLGNGGNTNSSVPVAVVRAGVLAGKSVIGIHAGSSYNLAWCADGTLVAWGRNTNGTLGNNSTTDSNVPVLVDRSGLADGERHASATTANNHSLAMVAMPPPPLVETLAANTILDTAATLRARADRNGTPIALNFEYGTTPAYGGTIDATPLNLTTNGGTIVAADLDGLLPGTTYHFRVVASGAGGTVHGEDRTFTTSSLASLAGLTTDAGPPSPAFDPLQPDYVITVPHATAAVSLTASLAEPSSTLAIAGQPAVAGIAAGPFTLTVGAQVIPIVVTVADASFSQSYRLTVIRLPSTLALDVPAQPAFTVPALAADGIALPVSLHHAPATGATLRLIENTGTRAIFGRFDGMPQGGQVVLNHGGIDYRFVANYQGGDGNDLVLHWANTRLLAWGNGESGQLGDGLPQRRYEPVPVDHSGALAGRTIIAFSAGSDHSLALCADGGVVSWGLDTSGQLGNGTQGASNVPVDIDASGVLTGKEVSAVSAGGSHNLALCSDGTLVAWGLNTSGQLGDGTLTSRQSPVEVIRTGALAGKTIAAISAGETHNLALCTDGTVVAWGANGAGRLGDGLTTSSPVPKLIDMRAVHGQTPIVAVAGGGAISFALDANGMVSSWGSNSVGQLGAGSSITERAVPGPLFQSGVLAGRKVIAIQAGSSHGSALCEDGVMAAWGYNTSGQLGDGTTSESKVPVVVQRNSQFSGKSVAAMRAGSSHNHALTTDGTLVGWGENFHGQLADGSSNKRQTMVLSAAYALDATERFISISGGASSNHGLAIVAMPPAPRVRTLAASAVGDQAATLHAEVSGQGNPASVVFEYGPTPAYGFSVAAIPSPVTGINSVRVSSRVTGLPAGTTYHFRVVATGPGGIVTGEDGVFTTSSSSLLAGLEILPGALDPSFVPARTDYLATVPSGVEAVSLRPVAASAGVQIRVNGNAVASGASSPMIPLLTGENEIATVVTSADGIESHTYRIRVLRLPAAFVFSTPDDGAIGVEALSARGDLPAVRLLYPPQPGTPLPLIRQKGPHPISGTFENLGHGARITLEHNGVFYPFVANYFGGDGNDLVLHWANTRPYAFGSNSQGQLGDGTFTNSPLPVAVDTQTALRGHTVLAVSAGRLHNLAVLEDGSVASWGYNESGILGDGSTTSRSTPVWVDREGVLAGRVVVAVAAGTAHSVALCADGTVATWGGNFHGQLGDSSKTSSAVPVKVDDSGILAGRRVIAIAAGESHSLALCEDGRIAAWGRNNRGQLGANVGSLSDRPVWVDHSGVLTGKTVVAIAAGVEHSLALCSDGTLAAWGANNRHQLGDNGTFDSAVPVRVRQGDLAGKTVVAIRSQALQNFALCSDGSIAAWGENTYGQLGTGGKTDARVPTAVATGKPAVDLDAGDAHGLAVFADGTAAAWGRNDDGRLGNSGTTPSELPVSVANGALPQDSRAIAGSAGQVHSLILTALPPAPVVATLAATAPRDRSATLNGTVLANGPDAAVWFELGTSPDFLDRIIAGTPGQAAGPTAADVMALATGLLPGTTYHYRMVAENGRGETLGEIRSFTTTTRTTLAALLPSQGLLGPDFSPTRTDYLITLPHAVNALAVTPTATHPDSPITVNGAPVASGTAGPMISLASGDNMITVQVTSADGQETSIYQILATRLPASMTIASVEDSLITAESFAASGIRLEFEIDFTPAPGTRLRLLTLTGPEPLIGRFTNLDHGAIVGVDHEGSTYNFVVNYYGGSGNDLELRWLNSRLMAWGANGNGQLGDDSTTSSKVPVPVDMSGVLNRRPVIQVAGNTSNTTPFASYNMALCADGSLAGWGRRETAQSFGPIDPNSRIPLVMDPAGALAGKSLTSLSAGSNFTLMLADDGTIASSGYNYYGTLGNGTSVSSTLPVAVRTNGALRGKRVVAVSAGLSHSLALCSDGTVAAWGRNQYGELGVDGADSSMVPVVVRGLPADHRVVAISAGQSFSLALLENGEILAWGSNGNGQLGMGDDQYQDQSSPITVDRSGVLAGKRIIAISAGAGHSLALSDDGIVYAWGANFDGQLGNGGTIQSGTPVEVSRAGLLDGRFVIAISAMQTNSLALCSDGTLAAWGAGLLLGNDISGDSLLPIAVSTRTMRPGEVFMDLGTGSNAGHAVAVTALPLPTTEALEASSITGVSATLHGTVNARGNDVLISIEYGLDQSFGTTVTAIPAAASGDADTAVSAQIAGLAPGTPYFYRIIAESYGGIVRSPAMTFTTLSDNSKLAGLGTSAGVPAPVFDSEIPDYLISVANSTDQISITPLTDHPGAKVRIAGQDVLSGSASQALPLAVGNNTLGVLVTAEDGIATRTYTLVVTRLPAVLALDGSGVPPVTADGFSANDLQAMFRLDFHPSPGSTLMVINNTSTAFIHGRFSNLAHGQRVWLSHEGVRYAFVANYHGGTGNDLVLQWAGTRAAAWGLNNYGQLGDRGNQQRLSPIEVDDTGVLADKTIFAVATGYLHSLALCSDGTLASWGYNVYGQLGDNGSTHRSAPVAVDTSGVLADKVVVAISSGSYHNLALCSDGSVAAWGFNNHGQLGDGTRSTARTPVLVRTEGVLAGKQVVAVAAGAYQSFALCSDGTLAAWGYNDEGELGNGGNTGSLVPVAVDVSGALAGRKVAAIAAGLYHGVALCTDGSVVSWGYNQRGQLGNSTTTHSASPIGIGSFGALAGKSVRAIAAGSSHSLALCTDGTLAAWGFNSQGQLGVAGINQSTTPVALAQPGRPLVALAAGAHHNLLRFTDGSMTAWGGNASGQLGSNSTQAGAVAVDVDTSALDHGGIIMFAASGSGSSHNLAVFAVPVPEPAGLQAWRLENFGDAGAGNPLAGDCADCDHDGIPNLVEYAFRLDPHQNSAGQVPLPKRVGNRFELRFSRSELAADIEYGAEWSPDLSPGSWRDVPDSGVGDEHVFGLPVDTAPNMFMRLRVRSVIPN